MTPRRLVLALAAVGFTSSVALAADPWKDKGQDCDKTTFKDPGAASVDALALCSKLWVAYRTDYNAIKGDYRDKVVFAMQLLYAKGSDIDAQRAKDILARMRVTDLPKRSGAAATASNNTPGATAKTAPARKTFSPPAPSKADIKKAETFLKSGYSAAKKSPDKALAAYLKAVDAAPGYPDGHYNAACIYALQKDEANMAKYLMNLRDLAGAGDKRAADQLKMTRTDKDFEAVRDTSTEFKRITGYARMRVINKLGELGEENVDNLVASMKKLGYAADSIEKDVDKRQKAPTLYYIDSATGPAYIVKQLIKHPDLEVKLMDTLCTEDNQCFDVVVQWGDTVKGDPKKRVADPKDAEKEIQNLERKQDEILAKPNEVMDDVEDALDKPAQVQKKVEDILDKPGKAVEKTEKTINRIKDFF